MVSLCVRGNDQQGLAGTRTALAVLIACDADLSCGGGADFFILVRIVGAVADFWGLVVVPAVGIVVSDNHRGGIPLRGILQLVYVVGDKGLLVQRIRIAGVAVLVVSGLQEGHGRQVALLDCGVEVLQVVLVVGAVGLANHFIARRRQVVRISSGCIVLERLVVRVVIRLILASQRGVGSAAAGTGIIGSFVSRAEAALEPAPGDVLVVELVADVLGVHCGDLVGACGGVIRAVVVKRVWVADDGSGLAVLGNASEGVVLARFNLLLLTGGGVMHGAAGHGAGNQVQRARGRRAENSGVTVVVQSEVLRIIPHASDGIAVVVAHGHARGGIVAIGGLIDVGGHGLWELVHLAAVVCGLLIAVVMVLVRSHGVVRPNAERLDGVGVLLPHYVIIFEVFRLWGAFFCGEFRGALAAALQLLTVLVQRIRVGSEVVVEGNVLRVDNYNMLDWGGSGRLSDAGDE